MKSLNMDSFEIAAKKSKDDERPMVVDFWATWCAPCRAMIPLLTALEKEYEADVDFYSVNVGEETALAQKWMIEAIPKIFIFDHGVGQLVFGPCSKAELSTKLDEILS